MPIATNFVSAQLPCSKGIVPAAVYLLLLVSLAAVCQPVSCTVSHHTQVLQFIAQHQSEASESAGGEQSIDVIIMLKVGATAEALQAICSHNTTVFAQHAAALNMSISCHLAGLCRHIYTERMSGLAGFFTPRQLSRLLDCLPPDSIDFIEEDFKVHKAEGPRPVHPQQVVVADKLSRKRARKLMGAAQRANASSSRHTTDALQGNVQETDGSSQLTTDPKLIALTREFMPASSLRAAGLASDFYGSASSSPSGDANNDGAPDSVEAANGPDPENSSAPSQFMAAGVKAQKLHTAQWNLDRVDQNSPDLNQTYLFGSSSGVGSGRGVNIYTLDSGIRRTHQEFQAWQGTAQRVSLGPSFASDSKDSQDCDGHGTHIASTAAGRSVGLAKEASLVAIRVLDCDGAGQVNTKVLDAHPVPVVSATALAVPKVSDVVAGLEWLALNYRAPAVVTMSLGVKAGAWSQTLQSAVSNLLTNHSITVVVATGNAQVDACEITPANVNGTLAVAGSDMSSKFDTTQTNYDILYEYDNTGSCVDIFAPGVDIMAACGGAGRCDPLNDSNYAWASGTSMAVPHVAAAAAIYLEQYPNAIPAAVAKAITDASSTGLLNADGMLPGTPNKLLFIDRSVI